MAVRTDYFVAYKGANYFLFGKKLVRAGSGRGQVLVTVDRLLETELDTLKAIVDEGREKGLKLSVYAQSRFGVYRAY